jgi:hypothetical protein
MKKFLIAYLFTLQTVWGGFPPPTVRGQGNTTKTPTFNLEVPFFQQTRTAGGTSLLELNNNNELVNPGFEHLTYNTAWTVGLGTQASSTDDVRGVKSIQLTSAGSGVNINQDSAQNSPSRDGVPMVASAWVKSTNLSGIQLCSRRNGVDDKCTPVGAYTLGSGWRQLKVAFLGHPNTNGITVKANGASGSVLVDEMYMGMADPLVDLNPDNVYSAKVSAAGVVTEENTDWINGNCAISSTNRFQCNYVSGLTVQALNCFVVQSAGPQTTPFNQFVNNGESSSAAVVYYTYASSVAEARAANLVCQKQGADYRSSKAYVASSSDTDWSSYTPIFSNFGTISPATNQCKWKRDRGDALVMCNFVTGTTVASLGSMTLPLGGSIDSSRITVNNTTASQGQAVGVYSQNGTGFGRVITATATNASVVYFGGTLATGNQLIAQNANVSFSASTGTDIQFRVPIQGWQDSGVIVGSFQGYNETPGINNPKTYSFKVGNTGTVTQDLGDLINGNCTNGSTGLYVCTYNSGKVTIPLNCTATNNTGDSIALSTQGWSTSGITFRSITTTTGALTNFGFDVVCHGY